MLTLMTGSGAAGLLLRLAAAALLGGVVGSLMVEWVRREDPGALGFLLFVAVTFVALPAFGAVVLTIPRFSVGIGALLGTSVAVAPLLVDFVPWLLDPHYVWDLNPTAHVIIGVMAATLAIVPGAFAGLGACVAVRSLREGTSRRAA